MTPPPAEITAGISAEISAEDISRVRWGGWIALAAVTFAWVAWVSSGVIAAGLSEARQQTQYQRLREDIAELKGLVRQLVKPPVL